MCDDLDTFFQAQAEDCPHLECVKVDRIDSQEIANFCGITGLPEFLVFKQGKEVAKVLGADGDKVKEIMHKQY